MCFIQSKPIVVKYWEMPSVAVCILGTDDRFWRSAVVNLLLTHKYAQYVCPASLFFFFTYDIVAQNYTFVVRKEWKGECPRKVFE